MKRICIVGGGFAGFQAALRLQDGLGHRRSVEVTLISDEPQFTYTPLLPDVATGSLTMRSATVRLSSVLNAAPFKVVKDRVVGFDFDRREVHGERKRYGFDYLLIAVGSDPDFHGISGLADNAVALAKVHDAMRIKARVVSAFRRAMAHRGAEGLDRALTFVIAGAGCCGVELACELASGVRQAILPKVDAAIGGRFRVVLVEPQNTVLARFDDRMQQSAMAALARHGVDLVLGDKVVGSDSMDVALEGGDVIGSENLIWTAGVKAPRWLADSGLPVTDHGRVEVYGTLEVAELDGVFAMGDCAEVIDADETLPMNAQVASQQGPLAADNVIHQLVGSSFDTFSYLHMGDLVTLGRFDAAASWGPVSLSGVPAFAVYRAAYTALAPTLTKKVAIAADWGEEIVRGRDWGRLLLPE